jgi:hypothetical protein
MLDYQSQELSRGDYRCDGECPCGVGPSPELALHQRYVYPDVDYFATPDCKSISEFCTQRKRPLNELKSCPPTPGRSNFRIPKPNIDVKVANSLAWLSVFSVAMKGSRPKFLTKGGLWIASMPSNQGSDGQKSLCRPREPDALPISILGILENVWNLNGRNATGVSAV